MRQTVFALLLPGAILAGCSRPADEGAARDLTLLQTPESSATRGIVSARELDRPDPEPQLPVQAPSAARPRLVPARAHAVAAARASESLRQAPLPVPNAEPAPAPEPTPSPAPVAAAAGAGTPLEPGQSVTLVPAGASAAPGAMPPTELVTAREMAGRRIIVVGDDRCVPGRGELLPGRHRFPRH
jgi:hypothetical protein